MLQARASGLFSDLHLGPSSGGHSTPEPPWLRRVPSEGWGRHLTLTGIVRDEVIPRLVMRQPTFPAEDYPRPPTLPDEQVAEFVRMAIAPSVTQCVGYFDRAIAQGHSPDGLFLSLLAPAACLLGRLWDEDLCTFADVTLGVGRLQCLVSSIRTEEREAAGGSRSVFLTGAPGEQHTLGLTMIEHFLRNAGWLISSSPASTVDELRDRLERERFAVIGLALSSENRLEQLAEAIRAVRRWSCNKSIGVMVGGPIFLLRPELTSYVGADASAVDGPTAVLLARKLLDVQQIGGRK